MKELLAEAFEKDLHFHELEDWMDSEVRKAYRKYKSRAHFPTPLDTLYVMHEADVVHIGNKATLPNFVRNFEVETKNDR